MYTTMFIHRKRVVIWVVYDMYTILQSLLHFYKFYTTLISVTMDFDIFGDVQ